MLVLNMDNIVECYWCVLYDLACSVLWCFACATSSGQSTWKPSWALGESQCCSLASWCRRSTRSSRQRTASAVSSCSCKMFQDVSRTLVGHGSERMAKAVKSFRQFRTKCIQATVYLSEDAFSSLSSGMLSKATFCVTQRPEAWQKQVTMILPYFTNVRQQHLKARLVISVAADSCSSFYHTAAGVWFACKFRKANDQPRLFPRNTRHRMHATAPSIRRLDPVCVHDVPF